MKKLYFLMALCLVLSPLFAQKNKQNLEYDRKTQEKKIEEADKILKKTLSYKQEKLGKLSEINQQIEQRSVLTNILLQEILLIDKEILSTDATLTVNATLLQKLKEEYAEMLYLSSKTKNSMEKLSFMFSSASFNQLMARLSYLKQYDEERKKQIKRIEKQQKELAKQKKYLEAQKQERADLLAAHKSQQYKLGELKAEQVLLVISLKNREKELFIEIENRKKAMQQLEKEVSDAVGRATKVESQISEKTTSKRTPEGIIATSKSFAEAKGKLIWPVKEGSIFAKFGKQKHPVLENITIDNLGVDIRTIEGEAVRAIYDGKVIAISKMSGNYYMVLVQHGSYFTVYAQLQSIQIKMGAKVKAQDLIGAVGANSEGVASLQFQVWQDKKRLNPEDWLAKTKQ